MNVDEVLFVGDTPPADIDGPQALGMRTALVSTGNWHGAVGDLKASPDLVLDSVEDLPARLSVRTK